MINPLTSNTWTALFTSNAALNENVFPVGPYFELVFCPQSGIVHYASASAADIIEDSLLLETFPATLYDLLDTVIVNDHKEICLNFLRKGIEMENTVEKEGMVINQEFNILTRKKSIKRILFQYKIAHSKVTGAQDYGVGKFIDISSMFLEGFPKMTVYKNNNIVQRFVASVEDMLKSCGLRVSLRDLEVLKLKSNGLRAKEIAGQLNISILAVYSIIRNLKAKNKMDILPLLHKLKAKGLLCFSVLSFLLEA